LTLFVRSEGVGEERQQGLAVGVLEGTELFEDEGAFDGGEDGFDDGGAEEAGLLPLGNRDLEGRRSSRLGSDGHDDEVDALAVKSVGADDDRRAFLGGGLIREGKRDEDDVAEGEGGHS